MLVLIHIQVLHMVQDEKLDKICAHVTGYSAHDQSKTWKKKTYILWIFH